MAVAPVNERGEVDTRRIVIAYAGTNFSDSNDRNTDFQNVIMGLPVVTIKNYFFNIPEVELNQIETALYFAKKIKEKYPNSLIDSTGHSLGGYLAMVVAIRNRWTTLDKLTKDTIIRTFGSLEPAKFVSRQLQPIQEEYLEKIMKLEETFTGQVLRIQSESDLLTMVASALKGKYIGREYFLTNAGTHSLSEIIDSEDARKEIEKITNQILFQKVNIDIDGDGEIDVRLKMKNKNLM